jgi:hypothetical protein
LPVLLAGDAVLISSLEVWSAVAVEEEAVTASVLSSDIAAPALVAQSMKSLRLHKMEQQPKPNDQSYSPSPVCVQLHLY